MAEPVYFACRDCSYGTNAPSLAAIHEAEEDHQMEIEEDDD